MGYKKGPPPDSLQVRHKKRSALDFMAKAGLGLPETKLDPEIIDRDNAFLLFASFSGDLPRTAAALNASPALVAQVAEEEGWMKRIESVLQLRKSGRPGDLERAINRTVNFVQAHQMRRIVETLIQKLAKMSPEDLLAYCLVDVETTHKDGSVTREKKIATRPFADLAAAMEKVQVLTYAATNDTVTERGHRAKKDEEDLPPVTDMHAAIAAAMAKSDAEQQPQAMLEDTQAAQVEALKPSLG